MIAFLGGDAAFKQWDVPTIPFHQLQRCSKDAHAKIFKHDDDAEFHDRAEDDDSRMQIVAPDAEDET